MSKSVSIGVDNVTKKVKQIYIGVTEQTYTLRVNIASYNWDGYLIIEVNNKQVWYETFYTQPPSFQIKKGDLIVVYTNPGSGEAYIGSYSGLEVISSSENIIEGKATGNVYVTISDTAMRSKILSTMSTLEVVEDSSTYATISSAKVVKKAYIGVEGKAKEFWPESKYIWKKYNTITTNSYNFSNSGYIVSDKDFRGKGPKYWFNDNAISDIKEAAPLVPIIENDVLVGLENVEGGNWYSNVASTIMNIRYNNTVWMKQFFMRVKERGTDDVESSLSYVDFLLPNDTYNSNIWLEVVANRKKVYYRYMSLDKNISYSQGTYISDVESNNPNTYPENGRASDGYWYVKQVV